MWGAGSGSERSISWSGPARAHSPGSYLGQKTKELGKRKFKEEEPEMPPKKPRFDAPAAAADVAPIPAAHAAAIVPFVTAPVPLIRAGGGAGGGSLVAVAAPHLAATVLQDIPLYSQ